MGSTPEFIVHRPPRAGKVAPNAAIVLEGYAMGDAQVTVTAKHGTDDMKVTVEAVAPLSYEQFRSTGTFYLVRPESGEWPHDTTVELVSQKPFARLDVAIGHVRDHTAPGSVSLASARPHRVGLPHPYDVVGFEHGVFEDAASPIVIVKLELDGSTRTGAIQEGRAGVLAFAPDTTVGHLQAITLTDVAGNSHRIVQPCGPAPFIKATPLLPLTCIAGTLEAVTGAPGTFIGTTDGAGGGFSRGHYVTTESFGSDVEISVSASRLTAEHEMPIEIAFRGGFFGVTGSSSWYLYEHDGHWTGWKPTPSPVGPGLLTLRVVQSGQRVSGYINGELAGTFDLERPLVAAPVGIHFKAHPNKAGQIQFHDFVARAVSVN